MEEPKRKIVRLRDIGGCFMQSLDGLTGQTIDYPKSDENPEVEVLLEAQIKDDNIWGADIEVTIFRVLENGWLGYYILTPGGYSEYTYDPSMDTNLYNKTDIEWLWRFALTDDIRAYEPVASWMSDYLMHKVLQGDISDGNDKV